MPATLMASFDEDVSVNGITWLKSHVASHFNCSDLKSAMVLLRILLALHDTNARANYIKWTKYHVAPHFNVLTLGMQWWPFMSLVMCHANTSDNCITQPQKSCHISFWSSWANKCNCTIDNTTIIAWCQCQHKMHHTTRKVILHLI